MKKIIVEWNEYMMTEDVATSLSLHALDRAAERGGEPIMQLRQEVENLVQQAEAKLIDFSNQHRTFLLKGKKGLAVVGSLIKKGADYIFKVITLHRKKNFVPNNPNDKVIDLSEGFEPYTKPKQMENADLEYAKRFIFKHFLRKDTNVIISRVSNLGEDLEDMMQDGIEPGQRTIFVKPEVEFITRDLTDNSERSVYIDLIEEYRVYHSQPAIHSSPEDSLDPKLKSKRWDKIYVEGNEVTPDEDLKSILDKTFNYPKN